MNRAYRALPPLRITPPWVYLAFVLCPAVVVGVAMFQPWVPPSELFRDSLAVAEQAGEECCHLYYGFISNLGILLWSATSGVCLFAGLLLYGILGPRNGTIMMLYAAILTGFLTLDDSFMIHERIVPKLFDMGKEIIFLVYACLIGFYIIPFRKIILTLDAYLLGISLSLFAVGIIVDVFVKDESRRWRWSLRSPWPGAGCVRPPNGAV